MNVFENLISYYFMRLISSQHYLSNNYVFMYKQWVA